MLSSLPCMTLLTWQADHFPSLLVSLFCLFCCFGFVLFCAFSVFVEIVTASWTMYRSMPAHLLWLPIAYVNASIRQFSFLQHVIERVKRPGESQEALEEKKLCSSISKTAISLTEEFANECQRAILLITKLLSGSSSDLPLIRNVPSLYRYQE